MKVGFFGAGTWGFSLANILAQNGHEVLLWARNRELVERLQRGEDHPKLKGSVLHGNVSITDQQETLFTGSCDVFCEAVTLGGIRRVFTQLKAHVKEPKPLVLTSKGIEHHSGLLPSEVSVDVLGEAWRDMVCCLSGPSHAEEVTQNLPTSVVCASYSDAARELVQKIFSNLYFRVYPNSDIHGVEFGGAMKNIIAIACGISDGMGFGDNTKALLMTRGLHEIRKLARFKGCKDETLNGLSGLGDLCATCLSTHSRNYNFGRALAKGLSPKDAQASIGMVVEGAYSCISAYELGKKYDVPLPITATIYSILQDHIKPSDAVKMLMNREIKEEHL
jgi:glycerol-3-phosphate dehydrogenase (NAD(P)+)